MFSLSHFVQFSNSLVVSWHSNGQDRVKVLFGSLTSFRALFNSVYRVCNVLSDSVCISQTLSWWCSQFSTVSVFCTIISCWCSCGFAGHQEHSGEHSHGVVQRLPPHRLWSGWKEDLQAHQEQGRTGRVPGQNGEPGLLVSQLASC